MTTFLTSLVGIATRRAVQVTCGYSGDLSGRRFQSLFGAQLETMGSSVKEIVNAKIAGKKVMVFSKSYCPFCTKAKKAFRELINEGVLADSDYEVMEVENYPNGEDIMDYLNTLTGGRSVPRVFIDGKFLGGGDDTVRMKNNGQLKAKLS